MRIQGQQQVRWSLKVSCSKRPRSACPVIGIVIRLSSSARPGPRPGTGLTREGVPFGLGERGTRARTERASAVHRAEGLAGAEVRAFEGLGAEQRPRLRAEDPLLGNVVHVDRDA